MFPGHKPAVLKDYRLSFDIRAMTYVEPSFANVKLSPGDEVHGVAFCMTVASMKKLDRCSSEARCPGHTHFEH